MQGEDNWYPLFLHFTVFGLELLRSQIVTETETQNPRTHLDGNGELEKWYDAVDQRVPL